MHWFSCMLHGALIYMIILIKFKRNFFSLCLVALSTIKTKTLRCKQNFITHAMKEKQKKKKIYIYIYISVCVHFCFMRKKICALELVKIIKYHFY